MNTVRLKYPFQTPKALVHHLRIFKYPDMVYYNGKPALVLAGYEIGGNRIDYIVSIRGLMTNIDLGGGPGGTVDVLATDEALVMSEIKVYPIK